MPRTARPDAVSQGWPFFSSLPHTTSSLRALSWAFISCFVRDLLTNMQDKRLPWAFPYGRPLMFWLLCHALLTCLQHQRPPHSPLSVSRTLSITMLTTGPLQQQVQRQGRCACFLPVLPPSDTYFAQ